MNPNAVPFRPSRRAALGTATVVAITAGLIAMAPCGEVRAQAAPPSAKKPAAGILYLADYRPDGDKDGRSPFDNATVDGVIFRTAWMVTETQDNVYDWGQIDRHLQAAKRTGKIFGLGIAAGRRTPAWFLGSGATTFSMTFQPKGEPRREFTMPVPWDRAFQDKWGEFLQVMAARYDAEPNLAYVMIAGLGQNFEPFMARSPEDVRAFEAMGGLPRWIEGSKAVIDLYAKHFRKTPFILTMHNPVPTSEAQRAIEAVTNYGLQAYPGRFGVRFAGLDAAASTADFYHRVISETSARAPVGYQTVWSTQGPKAKWLKGTLGDVLQRAVAMKAHFVEVYAQDCNNPQYTDLLKQTSTALRANAAALGPR